MNEFEMSMTQTGFYQKDMDPISKGMQTVWLDTMDAMSGASRMPFSSSSVGCSDQDGIPDCEKVVCASSIFWPFGFPPDCVEI